ncbi:MAG: Stp1/IreP family PP2C-type Ser/Thr phosphatase [Clostridia bacterium]|nr:Stp1/IreP family PP2C-type Ser/Thr phosphatase [Clostridia bacterium]
MIFYGDSNKGLIRPTNQDAYYIDENNGWVVVADGMGGHKGGEIASSITVNKIKESMKKNNDLKKAIEFANDEVYKMSNQNPEFAGMGTTVVLCAVEKDEVKIAHVGDSRAYKITDDEIMKITKDHSIVQQLIDSGTITEEQAKYHPQKNLITRAVGTDRDVLIDFNTVKIKKDEYILICSDGLSSYTDEQVIKQIVNKNEPDKAVKKLIDTANENGGKDNITVVLIKA